MKLLALLLLCAAPAFHGAPGQVAQPKSAIAFHCDCDDALSAAYAQAVAGDLAASSDFALAAPGAGIVLDVVAANLPGGIILSLVVLDQNGVYLGHSVQSCNHAGLALCAANSVSYLGNVLKKEQK